MFLECIDYINKVKTGPFAEHSNQLWGISGVSHWTKVNQGLIKMYKVEVSIFYANFESLIFFVYYNILLTFTVFTFFLNILFFHLKKYHLKKSLIFCTRQVIAY